MDWSYPINDSLKMREDLLKTKYAPYIRQAMQLSDITLKNTVKMIIESNQYQRNNHTHLVTSICQWHKPLSDKQRACLEIHYAGEHKLIPRNPLDRV